MILKKYYVEQYNDASYSPGMSLEIKSNHANALTLQKRKFALISAIIKISDIFNISEISNIFNLEKLVST
ncbi:43806_t:CDS:2 [Gigaspora margarita]|uniref:43806_t:CDS:1 n=1 Tax=Gigaspora margarita TaxID=4874 RepID=A0ABM8W255_GIGMA|nr:43806_t:CDS:2 [Gigaspora margarita]